MKKIVTEETEYTIDIPDESLEKLLHDIKVMFGKDADETDLLDFIIHEYKKGKNCNYDLPSIGVTVEEKEVTHEPRDA